MDFERSGIVFLITWLEVLIHLVLSHNFKDYTMGLILLIAFSKLTRAAHFWDCRRVLYGSLTR